MREDGQTDNRKIKKFPGCEGCVYADSSLSGYRKGVCAKYQYPDHKPYELLYGNDKCEFYKRK